MTPHRDWRQLAFIDREGRTASFTGVDTARQKGTKTGFNVGADVRWMFTSRIGAGALVRLARATIDLEAARRWYDSPEYRRAREIREGKVRVGMLFVEGAPPEGFSLPAQDPSGGPRAEPRPERGEGRPAPKSC